MRKFSFVLGSLLILFMATGSIQAAVESVSIDHIQGLANGDSAHSGTNIRFVMRFRSDTAVSAGISTGFSVYSPDGATWDSTRIDTIGYASTGKAILGKTQFDLGVTLGSFSADGIGADTVSMLAIFNSTVGMKGPFNDTVLAVTAYNVSGLSQGKRICIDSSWFRPGGTWKWAGKLGFKVYPTWSGVRCIYTLGVNEIGNGTLPREFALAQNYPNPFNPTTNINFDVPVNSHVTITIFNVLGQRVKTLVDKDMTANKYNADWDGTADNGARVSSGIYFYRMEAANFSQTKKMIMIK